MKKTKIAPQKKNNAESGITNIRARIDLKNTINTEVEKLNKLKKGSKKIIPSDILEALIPLLTSEIREQIIAQTITGSDKRESGRKTYIKKHGFIKESEFLDLIQDRKIELDDYLSDEFKSLNKVKKENLTINNKNVMLEKRSA